MKYWRRRTPSEATRIGKAAGEWYLISQSHRDEVDTAVDFMTTAAREDGIILSKDEVAIMRATSSLTLYLREHGVPAA